MGRARREPQEPCVATGVLRLRGRCVDETVVLRSSLERMAVAVPPCCESDSGETILEVDRANPSARHRCPHCGTVATIVVEHHKESR